MFPPITSDWSMASQDRARLVLPADILKTRTQGFVRNAPFSWRRCICAMFSCSKELFTSDGDIKKKNIAVLVDLDVISE